MVEQDWVRVVDARDILHVINSDFSASIQFIKADELFRIQIESSSTFQPKRNQLSGGHFQLSKNFNPLGRRNARIKNIFCIRAHLRMALKR